MRKNVMWILLCMFILLGMCSFKSDIVLANDNGCDIPSSSSVVDCYYDMPSTSSFDTWSSWISWYQGMGYRYDGCTQCRLEYANGWYTGWWISLIDSGGNSHYAILREVNGKYQGFYNTWLLLDEGKHVYYYTNGQSIIYQNTWVHTRTNNDYYQSTDPHGYFVFNSSGRMCTGWQNVAGE